MKRITMILLIIILTGCQRDVNCDYIMTEKNKGKCVT